MSDYTQLSLDLEPEIWKPIPDFAYEVSNKGNVRSCFNGNKRLLKPWPTTNKYLQVSLRKNKSTHVRLVHRLVAQAFLGECPPECEVNHKDGDRNHNAANNLEYITHQDNQLHSYRILKRIPPHFGETHQNAKFTEDDIRQIRIELKTTPVAQIAKKRNVNWSTINNIKKGETWKSVK